MRGHPEPRESSSLPRLRLVQSGGRREHAISSPTPQAARLPITPLLLRHLRPPSTDPSYDERLLWATAAVCFFGFFRAGEITVPSASAFDARINLSWGDVSIREDGRALRVFLKRSKTDQYGRGTEVFIGSTGDELCPVHAVRSYVARRGDSPGAFFCSAEGVPLSKSRFVELVRSALTRAGVPIAGYSGHSFRIGAASQDSRYRCLSSGNPRLRHPGARSLVQPCAFLRYIRTPREHLAQYSYSLAHGP